MNGFSKENQNFLLGGFWKGHKQFFGHEVLKELTWNLIFWNFLIFFKGKCGTRSLLTNILSNLKYLAKNSLENIFYFFPRSPGKELNSGLARKSLKEVVKVLKKLFLFYIFLSFKVRGGAYLNQWKNPRSLGRTSLKHNILKKSQFSSRILKKMKSAIVVQKISNVLFPKVLFSLFLNLWKIPGLWSRKDFLEYSLKKKQTRFLEGPWMKNQSIERIKNIFYEVHERKRQQFKNLF